ncbi:MAG TPA: hypothetical protein VG204_19580 [Terriglobia bacterium]|nr:hypothetical protein [Terriglobia bacterium]
MALRQYRVSVVVISGVAFLVYLVWEAHTPGEPRTMRDFLFLLGLCGVPFALLLYIVWSWMTWGKPAAEDSRRSRLALNGSAMGAASAAMLVLLLPLWEIVVQDERLAACWVGIGMLLSGAGTVCGLVGSPGRRRPAISSVFLLPFWLFAAGLLLKAVLD